MEDIVSSDNKITEEELDEAEEYFVKDDFVYEVKINYRFLRKKFFAFVRNFCKKGFKKILYITLKAPPYDYINAVQKQYPDKEIQVLIPIFNEKEIIGKVIHNFVYFYQNKKQIAKLYKIQKSINNIQTYGILSSVFTASDSADDISFIGAYAKCARIAVSKLKPDIVHSDEIPIMLGAEFEKKQIKFKSVQQISDFNQFNEIDPFWAIINMAEAKGIRRLQKDKFIQKYISLYLNKQKNLKQKDFENFLEQLYKNYKQIREISEQNENKQAEILFNQINSRVLKLFSNCFEADTYKYNPYFYTLKNVDYWFVVSKSYYKYLKDNITPSEKIINITNNIINKGNYIRKGVETSSEPIFFPFTSSDFREKRIENKNYLVKEFSESRIETGFTNINLFDEEEVKLYGYLDSYYESPLIYCNISNDIKKFGTDISICTILKLFEIRKNIRVIINIPEKIQNNNIRSFIEFCEEYSTINGRWLLIEGKVKEAQFLAASDMIMLPFRTNCCKNLLQTALNFGCVPIVPKYGIYDDNIRDILDDMTLGCGFKTNTKLTNTQSGTEMFASACLRAVHFYFENNSCWNLLIENCLKHRFEWDFRTIEKINNVYEELL